MQSISELLQTKRETKKRSERAQVISEIYEIYVKDKTGRRIENWNILGDIG